MFTWVWIFFIYMILHKNAYITFYILNTTTWLLSCPSEFSICNTLFKMLFSWYVSFDISHDRRYHYYKYDLEKSMKISMKREFFKMLFVQMSLNHKWKMLAQYALSYKLLIAIKQYFMPISYLWISWNNYGNWIPHETRHVSSVCYVCVCCVILYVACSKFCTKLVFFLICHS